MKRKAIVSSMYAWLNDWTHGRACSDSLVKSCSDRIGYRPIKPNSFSFQKMEVCRSFAMSFYTKNFDQKQIQGCLNGALPHLSFAPHLSRLFFCDPGKRSPQFSMAPHLVLEHYFAWIFDEFLYLDKPPWWRANLPYSPYFPWPLHFLPSPIIFICILLKCKCVNWIFFLQAEQNFYLFPIRLKYRTCHNQDIRSGSSFFAWSGSGSISGFQIPLDPYLVSAWIRIP